MITQPAMNTESAETLVESFLGRSPRPAMDVRVQLQDQSWSWQQGHSESSPSRVFEIGSVGKMFTTTLLALLVQDRQVSLSDPVERFYPSLPWSAGVTLEELATHTSGLPGNPFGQWQLMRRGRQLAEEFQPQDLFSFLQALEPPLKGAGKVRYSNLGMAVLGHILAMVCGKPYGEAVRSLILDPLGMNDTRLDPEDYSAGRLMKGHNARGEEMPPFAWAGMEAAGLWRSTGDDMMIFLSAQRGVLGEPWASLAEETTRARAKIGRNARIGLGWFLSDHKQWGPVAWHGGGTFGQHCVVAWPLDRSAAVTVLTNRMPPWWHHAIPGRQIERLPYRLVKALCRPQGESPRD
ncbi:beta-lactamase class C [Alkalispirochaeta americana]|uniref:Beta-lactamase class C n=1 Tax=Alkalispirochaeta americana TaxID=159291 RepID=A0A1N6W027_9SPIO|nr:serine hydrolase domain-containing protein [Alkalispirochaeta americana]SIQ83352.1 beta-lactamase class C [Alkalispirochaeta americana]